MREQDNLLPEESKESCGVDQEPIIETLEIHSSKYKVVSQSQGH